MAVASHTHSYAAVSPGSVVAGGSSPSTIQGRQSMGSYRGSTGAGSYTNGGDVTDGGSDEDNALISRLETGSPGARFDIIDQLRGIVQNRRALPFRNAPGVFASLSLCLDDDGGGGSQGKETWDVRHQGVLLVSDCIPLLGSDVDEAINEILPSVVRSVGDSKITLRRAAIQCLRTYMKHTRDTPAMLRTYVRKGMESSDSRVQKETIISLPLVLAQEFSDEDYGDAVVSLCKKLVSRTDETIQRASLITLDRLKSYVGDTRFRDFLSLLTPALRKYYCEKSGMVIGDESEEGLLRHRGNGSVVGGGSGRSSVESSSSSLRLGVIPPAVMDKLNDQDDFAGRGQAVEKLRGIVRDLPSVQPIMPHIVPLISLLSGLLEDNNFKVITTTLDTLGYLVELSRQDIRPHVKPVCAALTKRMGDNKNVVRQSIARVSGTLMQTVGAGLVTTHLVDNFMHRHSRVRTESINLLTSALLTFPSYDFDLALVSEKLAYCLIDSKRVVRHACLEGIAVLNTVLGAQKLPLLLRAVREIEERHGGGGAADAVQARLARRQLPRRNENGLIEPAVAIPNLNSSRSGHLPSGADVEWILAGSGGGGNSARSMHMEDLEGNPGSRDGGRGGGGVGSSNGNGDGSTASPKRYRSAGKAGKSKLPWEDTSTQQQKDFSKYGPLPKQTWTEDGAAESLSPKKSFRKPYMHTVSRDSDMTMDSVFSEADVGDFTPNASMSSNHRMPFSKAAGAGQKIRTGGAGSVSSGLGSSSTVNTSTSILGMKNPQELQNDGLSSSWPINRKHDDVTPIGGRPGKPYLNPISAPETPVGGSISWATIDDADDNPIPTRASMAPRHSAGKRGKVVPPIQPEKSSSPRQSAINAAAAAVDEIDSAYSSIRDSPESFHINKIRRSANQKRADKLFEKIDRKQTNSSSTSGSLPPSELSSPVPGQKVKGSKSEAAVDKPKPAKRNSLAQKKNGSGANQEAAGTATGNGGDHQHSEYNPMSGVTFKKNSRSDVSIVGKGYSDDAEFSMGPTAVRQSPPAQVSIGRSKSERRVSDKKTKGPSLSPHGRIGQSSSSAPLDDELGVAGPVGVFGRGVSNHSDNGTVKSSDSGGRGVKGSRSKGVYADEYNVDEESDDDDRETGHDSEEEEVAAISMSMSMREQVAKRKQEKERVTQSRRQQREKEMEEKIREDEERWQREQEERAREQERKAKEQEMAAERRRKKKREAEERRKAAAAEAEAAARQQSEPDPELLVAGSAHLLPQRKRTTSPVPLPPGTAGSGVSSISGSVSGSGLGGISLNEMECRLDPVERPDVTLREAMNQMSTDDWTTERAGLNSVRRLVRHHPDVLLPQLHAVSLAVSSEIKNLRSKVCRLAIATMGELYGNFGPAMDMELESSAKVLLQKSIESNEFIRQEVEASLSQMVSEGSAHKVLNALVKGGASHRSSIVRRITAGLLYSLVKRHGASWALSGQKDVSDKLLPGLAQLVQDTSPETRWFSKSILMLLMLDPDFNRCVGKHVPSASHRAIMDECDRLQNKGLGDMPSETPSAKGRRSGGIGKSRSGSAAEGLGEVSSGGLAGRRRPLVGAPLKVSDEEMLRQLSLSLGASDWQERLRALDELRQLTNNRPELVRSQINKIFDRFIPLLKDSNSKVNLSSLQTLTHILPQVGAAVTTVATHLIQTVSQNLASKNKDILEATNGLLSSFLDELDPIQSLTAFANQAKNASIRVKPGLVTAVCTLTRKVYSRHQKHVHLHVLPLMWELIRAHSSSSGATGTGALRECVYELAQTLHTLMGGVALIEYATRDPKMSPRGVQLLEDMVKAIEHGS